MKYLDHPFRVSTRSSRRPTPLTYEHLRQWLEKDERFLLLHSQTDITNIDQQLDQTTKIMISNVIQRVIAQIIGDKDPGFVTIKGTDDGALHVYLPEGLGTITANSTLQAGANLIGKVQIQDSSQTLVTAKIDIVPAATTFTITGTSGQKIHVVNLFFTVGAETNIVFKDGSTALTGAMDFGASGEPRGAVIPLGLGPLICSSGNAFVIEISPAVQVSGYCIYYKQLA